MADNGRWFKLWITAPADDAIQELPPALRWAWVAFGCYTKAHGTRGRVVVSRSNAVLAAEMGIDVADLFGTIQALPHVTVDNSGGVSPNVQLRGHKTDVRSDNGTFTVTWKNWTKYQEDRTVYERVKRLRSKKRRDEKRETTPVVTREETASHDAPDPPGDSDLASLWEGRTGPGPDRMEGRNGRTRYPVEDLVGTVVSRRALGPDRRIR